MTMGATLASQEAEQSKAAAYIRVSQERSARNGYGLDAQEHEVRRFLDYKGWELVELFRENGFSGYKRERPALDRLLAEAKKGNFNVVIFPSIDRAGRSVRDVIEIDQALRAAGVDTIFLREGVDTSTATGQLFRNIMASLAEFEGKVIYERLIKGKRRKASKGGYTGGFVPYGYRLDDKREYKVFPQEAAVVKRIFKWYAQGEHFPWIARQLTAEGVPTKLGGRWRPSTLGHIINNPFYTGKVKFGDQYVPGKHQPIISEKLFNTCQNRPVLRNPRQRRKWLRSLRNSAPHE